MGTMIVLCEPDSVFNQLPFFVNGQPQTSTKQKKLRDAKGLIINLCAPYVALPTP